MNIHMLGKYGNKNKSSDRSSITIMGDNNERSSYAEFEQVPVRIFHDIQIKGSARHFFHTQSASVVMKEFLKPL